MRFLLRFPEQHGPHSLLRSGRGPGDLEIEASRVGVYVQQLSGQIQPGNFLGLHGLGVYISHLYPAGGNDGLGNGAGTFYVDGESLQVSSSRRRS